MAQITSKVGLCNLALGHLKINPVSDIDTGTSTEELICAKYYDITRQAVIESYNWGFATKRAIIAEDSTTPVFGWGKQSSSMPPDFLRLIALCTSNGEIYVNTNNQYYSFEGGRILTDLSAPYYIMYTADIDDVSKFDRLFVMNFSYALATNMSENFKVSSSLLQLILQKWQNIWEIDATVINGNQSGVVRINQSNYVNSRKV